MVYYVSRFLKFCIILMGEGAYDPIFKNKSRPSDFLLQLSVSEIGAAVSEIIRSWQTDQKQLHFKLDFFL